MARVRPKWDSILGTANRPTLDISKKRSIRTQLACLITRGLGSQTSKRHIHLLCNFEYASLEGASLLVRSLGVADSDVAENLLHKSFLPLRFGAFQLA